MEERVQGFVNDVINEKCRSIRDLYECFIPFAEERIGMEMTPIEQLLYFALRAMLKETVYEFYITPQEVIGNYRVDFLVTLIFFSKIQKKAFVQQVVVETDGHNFHEKTREQVINDKRRDRYLQSIGFHVLHFTGSEVWKDPNKCATEVVEFLTSRIHG